MRETRLGQDGVPCGGRPFFEQLGEYNFACVDIDIRVE